MCYFKGGIELKLTKKIMSIILTVMLVLSCVPMSMLSANAADSSYMVSSEGCEHNFVDGYCEYCGQECEHWFTDGYCDYCGKECEHIFTDGYCDICGMECWHSFVDGYCEYCGKECDHSYVDGYCDICGIECEHNYVDNTCEYCGACNHNYVDNTCEYCGACNHNFVDNTCEHCGACDHNFVDGYCEYCGIECEHNFSYGYCDICGLDCTHNYVDGYCDICGIECEHSFIDGYCEYCGMECEHSYVDGYCDICGIECGHNFVDGSCEYCGIVCEHNFLYGYCDYCGKECEHNFIEDGFCDICYQECEHTFENGECTICHYVCEHTAVKDGYCEYCGVERLFELNSAGLTISGDVGVNLVFRLDDYVLEDEDAYFKILVPNGTNENGAYELAYETQIVKVTDALKSAVLMNGYMVTCYISAKEFSSDIITHICLSDGTKSQPIKYQAKQYLDQIMRPSGDPAMAYTRPFVKALLNYGAQAQLNFKYTPNGIANDSTHFTEEDLKLTVFSGDERTSFINDNTMSLTNSAEDKVKYYGSSLLLEYNTVIRHYFTLADSSVDVSTLNATVDGSNAEIKQKGSLYYVDIEDISPKSLGDTYTVEIKAETGTMTIEYSCMSYVAAALNKYTNENGECKDSSKQTLVNLVYSLYDYYKAAVNM